MTPSFPQLRSSVLPPDGLSVDEHRLDSVGRRRRVFEVGAVDNGVGVENDEVGMIAFAHRAAPGEAEDRGGQSGHAVHGILQRDQAEVACIAAEHPRSEAHTSELQSLMRISYAVFCLKKKK